MFIKLFKGKNVFSVYGHLEIMAFTLSRLGQATRTKILSLS